MDAIPLLDSAANILSHVASQPPLTLVSQRLVNSVEFRHSELTRLSEQHPGFLNRRLSSWHTKRLQNDVNEYYRLFPDAYRGGTQ